MITWKRTFGIAILLNHWQEIKQLVWWRLVKPLQLSQWSMQVYVNKFKQITLNDTCNIY